MRSTWPAPAGCERSRDRSRTRRCSTFEARVSLRHTQRRGDERPMEASRGTDPAGQVRVRRTIVRPCTTPRSNRIPDERCLCPPSLASTEWRLLSLSNDCHDSGQTYAAAERIKPSTHSSRFHFSTASRSPTANHRTSPTRHTIDPDSQSVGVDQTITVTGVESIRKMQHSYPIQQSWNSNDTIGEYRGRVVQWMLPIATGRSVGRQMSSWYVHSTAGVEQGCDHER